MSGLQRCGALAVACLAVLAGCATPGQRPVPVTPEAARIENVPFFPDDTDQCGPSTLASVLSFWDRPTPPDVLRSEIYLPNIKGTLPMDLLPAVESRGLKATVTNGTLEDLQRHVREGRPVLAYFDLGLAMVTRGHYVVVTGFDGEGIHAHSGKKPDSRISYRKLERIWGRTDRWMLVVEGPAEEKQTP